MFNLRIHISEKETQSQATAIGSSKQFLTTTKCIKHTSKSIGHMLVQDNSRESLNSPDGWSGPWTNSWGGAEAVNINGPPAGLEQAIVES